MGVSIDEYGKALLALEIALNSEKSDLTRDATIQRFEFCVELAWKMAKKKMGATSSAPRQVVREMGNEGLIDDIKFWLQSIEYRNLSLHTYNVDLAEKVYEFAHSFLPKGKALFSKLELL